MERENMVHLYAGFGFNVVRDAEKTFFGMLADDFKKRQVTAVAQAVEAFGDDERGRLCGIVKVDESANAEVRNLGDHPCSNGTRGSSAPSGRAAQLDPLTGGRARRDSSDFLAISSTKLLLKVGGLARSASLTADGSRIEVPRPRFGQDASIARPQRIRRKACRGDRG